MCKYIKNDGTPAKPLKEIVDEAIELQNQIEKLKKEYEEKKLKILEICQKYEIDEFDVEEEDKIVHINYIKETKRKSFDSKKFKLEHPDMYNKYIKESLIKASVRFKIVPKED